MPLYEEKLINPLAVRFSQDRIWPDFQDGTRIEDSLRSIGSVPLKSKGYDLVLRPPFPPMEVIRLRQEIREADGERARDEKGKRMFGEESWFTFDNRRLYCLQRAALQLWPMVVAVVVKVLFDFPDVRCARHKFRTTSDGCSVKISLPDGTMGQLWNWQEAAKAVRTTQEDVRTVFDAVRRDTGKNRKEQLADVPPIALLSPGTREATVAERFNLGVSAVQAGEKGSGQAAGQQLLSLLHGGAAAPGGTGGSDAGAGGGGLAALFSQASGRGSGCQDASWQEEASWQGSYSGYGNSWEGADARGQWHGSQWQEERAGGGRGRGRRRRPKGGGKGGGEGAEPTA